MEIYTDKQKNTAVLICDANEIYKLENGAWRSMARWYDKANTEENAALADIDKNIADQYSKLSQQLKNAYLEIKEEDE